MANALFDKARQRFLEGQFNWNTDTIKAVLVDTGTYTVNLSAHEFLSDIGTGARIATSGSFTGKSTAGGAADANDITFTSVTGASINGWPGLSPPLCQAAAGVRFWQSNPLPWALRPASHAPGRPPRHSHGGPGSTRSTPRQGQPRPAATHRPNPFPIPYQGGSR